MASDAQYPDARFGEEFLALLFGHPSGHASSLSNGRGPRPVTFSMLPRSVVFMRVLLPL